MKTRTEEQHGPVAEGVPPPAKPPSKKEQILSLFQSGIDEVADIAAITGARPSYVASVLQGAGLVRGYFDLYTSTGQSMNVYSKFFANRLGFRDESAAGASVAAIDRLHGQFEMAGDRAGQHHALTMALTMFDRARWTGKQREAEVFRRWLLDQLQRAALPPAPAGPAPEAGAAVTRPAPADRG